VEVGRGESPRISWACYLQPPPSSDGSATSKTGATNRNSAAESVADVADDGGMLWVTMPAKDQQNRAMLPMLRTWRETGGECQHPLRQTTIRSTSPSLCVERLSFAPNAASLPTANRCRPSPTTGDGRGCISAAKRLVERRARASGRVSPDAWGRPGLGARDVGGTGVLSPRKLWAGFCAVVEHLRYSEFFITTLMPCRGVIRAVGQPRSWRPRGVVHPQVNPHTAPPPSPCWRTSASRPGGTAAGCCA
jgi:hypothetical protein